MLFQMNVKPDPEAEKVLLLPRKFIGQFVTVCTVLEAITTNRVLQAGPKGFSSALPASAAGLFHCFSWMNASE